MKKKLVLEINAAEADNIKKLIERSYESPADMPVLTDRLYDKIQDFLLAAER